MSSLKKNTVRGFIWSFVDSFGSYAIKFGFSVAIARALAPEDYGIMGMIVIFIALGQTLMMSGFSMALIQKPDTEEKDYSTVFWYNLSVGLLMYLVLFLTSDIIAGFYNIPLLKSVTRVAALSIIINSLACVPLAMLSRQMNFRKQASVNLVSSLSSGVTGVLFAYSGFGVWALVIQTIAGNIVSAAGFFVVCKWKPRLLFNKESFITLNRYGYKILLQGLGDVVFSKMYFPIIGKFFAPAQLGYYTNANRFYEIFVRQVSNAFSRVLFPAFSSIQNEKERVTRSYLKSSEMLFFYEVLATVLLIITARPFVNIFLTEKWLPAVPLMMLFFIEGIYFPLFMVNQNLLCSLGKSGTSLKVDIFKKLLTFVSILLTFRYGIKALIIGQLASSFVAFIVSVIIVFRSLHITEFGMMKNVLLNLLAAGVCAVVHYFFLSHAVSSEWLLMVADITILPLIYFFLSWLFRLDTVRETAGLIHSVLNREKKDA